MRGSWLNRRSVIAAVAMTLVASSQVPSRIAAVYDYPRHIVEAILSPITHGLKMIPDTIAKPTDLQVHLGDTEQLQSNLEQALQYNERLRQELAEARKQIAQLSRVRQQTNLEGVELVWAGVTSWSDSHGYPILRLNRGSRAGLMERYVVASGFNLIGRVVNVGPMTATVRLITARDTHIAVRLVSPDPNEAHRAMLAQATSVENQNEFWAIVDAADPVQVGDLAHLADDGWPNEARGLVVGKVIGIENDPDDPTLRRKVVIAPVRSLSYLDRVVVICPVEP